MNVEMISHKNNKIWILMNEAFKNRKIFIDKWVYKCKKNIHEKVIRYKIRWCVKNFEQLKNFDYYEIFVSIVTVRILTTSISLTWYHMLYHRSSARRLWRLADPYLSS